MPSRTALAPRRFPVRFAGLHRLPDRKVERAVLLFVDLDPGAGVGGPQIAEAALLIALFGFVGSAAMAKFLLRGEVIE